MESTQDNFAATAQTTIEVKLNKPVLRRGSRGEAVMELQRLLAHWGLYTSRPIDGIFDEDVEIAVKAYQCQMFLVQDAIVGQLTWQALYSGAPVNMPTLQRGSQGQAVRDLQQTLSFTGDYQGAIDGIFGPRTDAAVRAFQRRSALVIDGIVAYRTWHALSKVRKGFCQPMGC